MDKTNLSLSLKYLIETAHLHDFDVQFRMIVNSNSQLIVMFDCFPYPKEKDKWTKLLTEVQNPMSILDQQSIDTFIEQLETKRDIITKIKIFTKQLNESAPTDPNSLPKFLTEQILIWRKATEFLGNLVGISTDKSKNKTFSDSEWRVIGLEVQREDINHRLVHHRRLYKMLYTVHGSFSYHLKNCLCQITGKKCDHDVFVAALEDENTNWKDFCDEL